MTKPRVKLEDLPQLVRLADVAAFLGVSESSCRRRVDAEPGAAGGVLRLGGGVELPVWRMGRGWVAWKNDIRRVIPGAGGS